MIISNIKTSETPYFQPKLSSLHFLCQLNFASCIQNIIVVCWAVSQINICNRTKPSFSLGVPLIFGDTNLTYFYIYSAAEDSLKFTI